MKLAGADSEAGRKLRRASDAPKSLLSATPEQLERIASGTRQAVSQGLDAAGTALSRTYHELAHNEELRKGVAFGFKAAGRWPPPLDRRPRSV